MIGHRVYYGVTPNDYAPANPPRPIRLVASDLDGTLLRPDLSVSRRTREALARVRAAGVLVVLVTGRPPRMVREFAREAGVGGIAVCVNGAVTYDLDSGRVIRHHPISGEVAACILRDLRAALPGAVFGFELELEHATEDEYALLAETALQNGAPPPPVSKLIVRHRFAEIERLCAAAQEVAGDRARVHYSGAPFVELSAPDVDKARALALLCTDRGITADEVIAFGDMPNDLPMLRWAGRSVAVANAHPRVLEAASERTLSNEEDGVAAVLERLVLPVPA